MDTHDLPVTLRGTAAPVRMWAHEHDVDQGALQQLRRIAGLPWVEGVRVMPDVHLGKGTTVGSVIGMRDAVSPSAVGVDIGCGMTAVPTSLTVEDLPDDLRALRLDVESAVPAGFSAHDGQADAVRKDRALKTEFDRLFGGFDWCSASHGAGRRMSRGAAKRTFSVEDLARQTAGVECRKDAGVIDEIPAAYKDISDVIKAQDDLVEVVERLTTLMCIKG